MVLAGGMGQEINLQQSLRALGGPAGPDQDQECDVGTDSVLVGVPSTHCWALCKLQEAFRSPGMLLTVSCQGPFPPLAPFSRMTVPLPSLSAHLTPESLIPREPLSVPGKLPMPWPHCGSLSQ